MTLLNVFKNYSAGAWIKQDTDVGNSSNMHYHYGNKTGTTICYRFSEDIEAIAMSEDVIFGDTQEEAMAKIQELYPIDKNITHPFIENIIPNYGAQAENLTVLPNYIIQCTSDDGSLDLEKILKEMPYIKEVKINLNGPCYSLSRMLDQNYGGSSKTLREVFNNNGIITHWNNILRYEPDSATQALKSFKKNKTRQKWYDKQVRITHIREALSGLQLKSLDTPRPYISYSLYRSTWYDIEEKLYFAIDLFNQFYGKNAHRRTAGFIQLKARWKSSAPAAKKKFKKTFHKFMENELKAPNYKPKTTFKVVKGLVSVWANNRYRKDENYF